MTLQTIPLAKLIPSAANVRKTGGASIEELAASIASTGLLNNLVVRPVLQDDGTPTGKYEVVAGGRRLAALKHLAKAKRIAKNVPVPCNVLDAENPTEVSLAENVIRLAMHPADQFEAFAALVEQGLDVEEIAARFGTSSGQVKKLLRLSAVSPHLVTVYREGGMTLEQLMAFAVTDDHEAQERVWSEKLERNPSGIRRALTEAWVDVGHRYARFVGIDAYVAAGGTVERDLFQEQHEGYLTDRTLLDRLVREKLDALGDELRAEGWQWVEMLPDSSSLAIHDLHRLTPETQPLSDEDQAEQDVLATEYDALASEDVDDEAVAERLEVIDARLQELSAKSAYWPDYVKSSAGVGLRIAHNGTVEIVEGLTREKHPARASNDNITEKKARPLLASSLVRSLSAQRSAALRVMLVEQPDVALEALVYTLALPLFYKATGLDTCLDIRIEHPALGKEDDSIEESPAMQRLVQRHETWTGMLPEADAFWPWLRTQSIERKLELLAFCTAQTLTAVQSKLDVPGYEQPKLAHADVLHTATALDMAQWWEPTRRTYLGRVSKDLMLQAVREARDPHAAASLNGDKREKMIARAEKKLAGTGWLPSLLRSPLASDAPAAEEPTVREAA